MSAKSYEDPDVSVGADNRGQEELAEKCENSKDFPARAGPDLSAALHSVINRPLGQIYCEHFGENIYSTQMNFLSKRKYKVGHFLKGCS